MYADIDAARACQDALPRLVEDFAAELLSRSQQERWQFLKQQILGALELYYSRLYSLETLRRSA